MRLRVALLGALLLAGCAKPEPATEAALQPGEEPPAEPPARPDGRDGGFAAFNETNRTEAGAGGVEHAHDLWEGRERVTLFEGEIGLTLCCLMTKPAAMASLRLPEGAMVLEGTGAVEITLSDPHRRACSPITVNDLRACTDAAGQRVPDPAGGPPGIHVLVRDAAAAEARDAGDVTWGKALVMPVTDARQTDMPHSVFSLWSFAVRSEDPRDDTLVFHAKVDIVRAPGIDVPRWPGHPDFYAESTARVVLDEKVDMRDDGVAAIVAPTAAPPAFVPAQKLVSYGTRALHVFVNVTKVEPDDPTLKAVSWVLVHHNASGRARSNLSDADTGATSHAWTIPVDDAGMDSPYAAASRWGFRIEAILGAETAGFEWVGCSGCTGYDASYDIVVIATAEPPPADEDAKA